jgi:hypothetical protein
MLRQILRSIIHGILPRSIVTRRIPFGLAKGVLADVDFRWDTAFYFGMHEPELHVHYRRLLKPGMKAFDIGTHRGWDALAIAHITKAPVISFDLNPSSVEMARHFLAPAGLPIAIEQALFGPAGITIDQAAQKHFIPDFIKMDIEGAEADALRGALETLKAKPALIIEVHGEEVEADCLDILLRYGYSPQIVNPRRHLFSERRGMGHNRWLVCNH